MKQRYLYVFLFGLVSLLSSCEAIGTIFKAGMWWGIIVVVGIIGIILWLFFGRKK